MTDTHIEGRVEPATTTGGESPLAEATNQATDLAHTAGDELGTVLDTTKQQARGLFDDARMRVADEADSATGRAAEALSGTARDLTDLASGHGAPDSQAAHLVRQVGERVDRAATRLQDRGYQGVADDVSRWARANPGAFLAAAAGAGFLIGRVFRAADTKGVVDAAKGASSADQQSDARPRTPQLDAGDSSLFAEERRTETAAGGVPPAFAPIETGQPLDLTDPPSGPVAGV